MTLVYKVYRDDRTVVNRCKRGNSNVNLPSHHGCFLLNPHVHHSLTSPGFKSRIEHGPYLIIKNIE